MGIGREGGVEGEAMVGEEKLLRVVYFLSGNHRRRYISRRQEGENSEERGRTNGVDRNTHKQRDMSPRN